MNRRMTFPPQVQAQQASFSQPKSNVRQQGLLQPKMQGVPQQPPANRQGPRPVAPPVYRPQPTPRVLQTKSATSQPPHKAQTINKPVAPPAYRPNPVPHVLQRKAATPVGGTPRQPVAPPVYRPEQKRIVQPKMAAPARQTPKPPPVYRPGPKPLQPKLARQGQAALQMKPKALPRAAQPGRPSAVGHPRGVIQGVLTLADRSWDEVERLEATFGREAIRSGLLSQIPTESQALRGLVNPLPPNQPPVNSPSTIPSVGYHQHDISPPDWRNYLMREYEGVPLHHKFPKRSLHYLWAIMTDKQRSELSDLGINSPKDLKSMPFNLIRGETSTKVKIPPEKRWDDPDHFKSDKIGALRKQLAKKLSVFPLDLAFTSSGAMTPRSAIVSQLNLLYEKIVDKYEDYLMLGGAKHLGAFKIDDKDFGLLHALLEEGTQTHFSMSKGTNELSIYKWKQQDEYFYMEPEDDVEVQQLDPQLFKKWMSDKQEELNNKARNKGFEKRYYEALSEMMCPPPMMFEDQTRLEYMQMVIDMGKKRGKDDEDWSDV